MNKLLKIKNFKGCRMCPVNVWDEKGHIVACGGVERRFSDGLQIQINSEKAFYDVYPAWCPLVDIPEYKLDWSGGDSYEAGWNDVLDLIGGDK